MPPSRRLSNVTSPAPVRVTYQLVVRPYTPEDPGEFVVTTPRRPGWNLALSWVAMVVVVLGLVVLLIA